MDKKKITEQVTELVLPIVEAAGLELVDVEYVRERDWFLRVFIDKEGGIDIDDCSAVSNALAKLLDEKDFIKDQYYLEVSSPGIDRPLKKDKELEAHYGTKVDLAFYVPFNGSKQLTVVLTGHDADNLQVTDAKNKPMTIERKLVASVRPHIDF
ncbi:ribosome maturation factor RimP [Acidaminococcus sp. NSJ-142]|jgi:ribosome maturation factor RimP|uniref:ribosome maturation factor RimP n=1 Tax=Acidaminococcus TaxID=904 RepID=UPI000CF90986|nr:MULTISPECIES: ribosome maturation factor RimP [Acidaminococcus]MCD2435498.1 ribosome maturation factor RimP [Acidaminococcus hominis]MCH4095230.1 ribosome maturation factor RimP [Acidaminococcus provencensis]RHK03465.1 ribosome maturation factor RimP [Acidaminococcus sp. AM05-11]